MDAKDLKTGDQLRTSDGDLPEVVGTRARTEVRRVVKWSRPDWDGWKHVQETHREGAVEYLKDPLNKGVFSGKFVKGEELKKRLQEVNDNGRASPNTGGMEGTVYEYDFHKRIAIISRLRSSQGIRGKRMILLTFSPDEQSDFPSPAARPGTIDLTTESSMNLRYGFFVYPVNLRVDGVEFLSAARVPLIDIMFTVAYSLKDLDHNGAGEVDFTENARVIYVTQQGDNVVFTDPHAGTASCLRSEYFDAVRDFARQGIQHLADRHPEILSNKTISELRELIST
ncbi:hypothetical protein [Streptomyces monomycini]|uniref:hypothetical protein n=1 Tax=Streptomyces monomycini TaxID=371720 RepID=UPI0012FF40F7|nr:hypothetical protein [Streptomyces monomycini]